VGTRPDRSGGHRRRRRHGRRGVALRPDGWAGARRGLSPEDELAERIRVVHQRDPTQGVPRIAAELNVSRRLAGWAIAEHMRTELVADALTAARDTRGSLAGAVFHSDHSLSSTPRRTSRSSARAWG